MMIVHSCGEIHIVCDATNSIAGTAQTFLTTDKRVNLENNPAHEYHYPYSE
jgi:hypothetical protein